MKTTPKKIHFHHQDHQGHQEQSDIKQWAKLGVLGGLNGCFDVFPFRTLRESELTPARQKETFAATRQSPETGVNEFTKTTKLGSKNSDLMIGLLGELVF